MISVGGYTYGNANEWSQGTEIGQRMVPFFGGVYTRFDMTVANNWDINLQYNNDPFFDSTGFARLTYRMGGSRRRNVPDRLEQPLMRNEHIVRAHQTPEYLTNTQNNGTPWNVIHVDNTAAPVVMEQQKHRSQTLPMQIPQQHDRGTLSTFTKETAVLLQISMMIHFPSIKTISFLSAAADHSPSLLARVAERLTRQVTRSFIRLQHRAQIIHC